MKLNWILATVLCLTGAFATQSASSQDASYGFVFIQPAGESPVEILSYVDFEKKYGPVLPYTNPVTRDVNEGIIPTPGPPSPSSNWQPGDQVQFFRDAMFNGNYYTRNTVYRRYDADWGVVSNIFRQHASLPPGCSRLPCPPSNPQ